QRSATAERNNVLSSKEIALLLKDKLSSETAKTIFSEKLVTKVLNRIKTQEGGRTSAGYSLKAILKRYAPKWIKRKVLNMSVKAELNYNLLALSMFIASEMYTTLTEDAERLKPVHDLKDGY